MTVNQRWQVIPTQLDVRQFEEFILPHLSAGRREPASKLSLHTIFNYILRLLIHSKGDYESAYVQ